MEVLKYTEILKYEQKLIDLFNRLDLYVNKNSRIFKYFVYLRKIEDNREKGNEEFSILLNSDKPKFYFCLYYTMLLSSIVDCLNESTNDDKTIKCKLLDITKGTYLLSEENPENTIARDTSFELELFSFLHRLGTKISFGSQNPDLIVETLNFKYNIECKRPASYKSIDKNIRKALKQLRKPSVPNGVPVIALSLDKVLINDDLIFNSNNEETALKALNKLLFDFNNRISHKIKSICGNQSCVFLFYLSCLSGFNNKLPMAIATYMVGNVYNFESSLSHKLYDDLNAFAIN